MALIGKVWDKWDVILILLLAVSVVLTVTYPRIKANVIYGRFPLDFVTETSGELIVWENASVGLQILLGWMNLFGNFIFAILLTAIGLIVGSIFWRAGWRK